MTILTTIQNASLELGLQPPTAVVTATDIQTLQLLRFAKRILKEVSSKSQWPQLRKQYLNYLSTAQSSYAFPTDYDYMIPRTQWDRTYHWELVGPVSPQEWQLLQSGIIATVPRRRFRNMGSQGSSQFNIFPTPQAGDDNAMLVYEYQSQNYIYPRVWASSSSFASNTYCSYGGNMYYLATGGTTGATPPTWMTGVSWSYYASTPTTFTPWTTFTNFAAGTYCSNAGHYYYTTLGGYSGATAPTWTTTPAGNNYTLSDSGGVPNGNPITNTDGTLSWTYFLGPYNEFLADTDTCEINEDVIGLGIQAEYWAMKGLDYEPIKERYDNALRAEMSSIKSSPTISLNRRKGSYLLSPLNVPDTGYGPAGGT